MAATAAIVAATVTSAARPTAAATQSWPTGSQTILCEEEEEHKERTRQHSSTGKLIDLMFWPTVI
jgi:hypothetical protein